MKKEIVNTLTKNFEDYVNKTKEGVEFWFARDLQKLLGYSKWQNFVETIRKAKISCDTAKQDCQEHFTDISKVLTVGNGAQQKVEDICLTRYACYLIAQNGDSSKPEIAFAQSYFAVQTRKAELIEERILQLERLEARKKLTQSEKELSGLIYERTGKPESFALIRSRGDIAFFGGRSTKDMKVIWKVKEARPLADFMPTVLLTAKDLANQITVYNSKEKSLRHEGEISSEHVTNNASVRKTLIERGIVPERVRPQDDIKKIERKVKKVNLISGKNSKRKKIKNKNK